ncbi:MAG: UvrD-helicase domain-containing protein [Ktedonobacteraceae bacterium]
MDDRIRATAVAAARQLLLRYRDEHPVWTDDTTPIEHIVAWLGLQVETFHPHDYPQGTYGFLEPHEDLIWLCRDLVASLRRFTLAHELGHAVLHRSQTQPQAWYAFSADEYTAAGVAELSAQDPCQQPDVQEEMAGSEEQERLQEALGSGQLYDPRSERELAANIFAAELLMPLERVRTLFLNEHVPAHQLASLFTVSNAAMLNRLAGLLTEPVPVSGRPRGSPLPYASEPSVSRENDGRVETEYSGRPATNDHHSAAAPKKQYDAFQQAAIEAQTPALIVAGPGSGKTSTLIGRSEYLITTLSVRPEHILALTFSRKAAQEMQERLELVLNFNAEAHVFHKSALPMVSTFHAFCADLLRTYGELVGLRPTFALLDDTEGYFLLRQLTQEMRLSHYRNLVAPARYFPDFLKAISRAKDELVAPAQYEQLAQHMWQEAYDEESKIRAQKALEVAAIYALYQQGLRRQGDTDFGGLIMLTVQLLEQFPEVCHEQQQRFQHILVDEFQDINRASGVLLRLLAGEQRNVWVVGDANQAIYGFRGASPANIANFKEDYPGAVVLPLSRNYRSRPDIVQLAESFRRRQLEPGMATQLVTNEPARLTQPDTYVTLATAPDAANEIAGLIADIRYQLTQGYSYADIAILCRTRARAATITRALALAELPVIETRGLLGQQHIRDLISIMLLLADASGMGILRAARQHEHALSQSDIEALLLAARDQKCSPGRLIARDEAPLNMSIEGRHSLSHLSKTLQNLFQYAPNLWSLLAQYLFLETATLRTLLQNPASQYNSALLADYAAFLRLARRYDQQQQAIRTQQAQEAEERGEKVAPPLTLQEQTRGFIDYLNVMLTLGQEGGNRQQGVQDNGEDQANVIRVMTVHASKGLEFPVVYLPGLISRNFPLQAHANPVPAPLGMLPVESEDNAVHESGEACLFYVGVTRARDSLVLSYSERNGKQKAKPSVYLETLLAGLPTERLTCLSWQGSGDNAVTDKEGSYVSSSDETEGADEAVFSSQPSQNFIDLMKPAKLKVTDIETYQRCPRKYLYSTLYGFRSEEGTYQLFWHAIQMTLETLQKKLAPASTSEQAEHRVDSLPTQEDAQEIYSQHWQELGGPALPFAQIYEQHGHEVTELIWRKLLESGNATWELRPGFTVEAAGQTITVSIDRVEMSARREQPPKFVRTRFGKRNDKPTTGTRELLYARAYRQQHGGQSMELHFHNLSTGETLPIKLTARKEQSLLAELEQAISGLERNEFPALPDAFMCPACPFFLICPA